MRIHGLVLLSLLSLTRLTYAQSDNAPEFLPPSPTNPGTETAEPMPLPPAPSAPGDAELTIEAEIKKFRTELREFQSIREDVSLGTKTTAADTERMALQQRQELLDLLAKLAKAGMNRRPAPPASTTTPGQNRKTQPSEPANPPDEPDLTSEIEPNPQTTPIEPIDIAGSEIADPFGLGKVLFRGGDFVGAEKAFRKAKVSSENEMMLKYLLATCLRRQSKWQPAIEAYKTVAESNLDPVLRDLAKWQLDNIRWHQQTENQLEQLRKQREKRTDSTKSPSASLSRPRK